MSTGKILVVDDNVDAAITTGALLKAWGHEVVTVFSGDAALEEALKFHPELVLLDIGMPGMSGYELARVLRSNPVTSDAVLAAVTGYGQESDRQRSFETGFDYHFVKPLDASLLAAMLASPQRRTEQSP